MHKTNEETIRCSHEIRGIVRAARSAGVRSHYLEQLSERVPAFNGLLEVA